MDIIAFALVVWFIKVLAEDGYATVKGQSNPRMDRRRARQKSRAGNPIWNQFLGWLGDVAEDARQEAGRAREEKRERQAEARRKRDLEEHPTVDAEVLDRQDNPYPNGYNPDPDDPSVIDMDTPSPRTSEEERHENLTADECDYDICKVHGKVRKDDDPQPSNNNNNNNQNTGDAPNEGDDMSEINGLDQAIAYAKAVKSMAAKHGTAGNEGYIGHLTERSVAGEALQSAYDMQAAMSAAMAAAEHHESELTKQKAVQEQYDANSDAGDKQFQTEGR